MIHEGIRLVERIVVDLLFLVVICGSIMTMPGLPRVPAAENIRLNEKGDIEVDRNSSW